MTLNKDNKRWIARPQIPAIYVKTVLNIASKRGLDVPALLQLMQLDESDLAGSSALVSPVAYVVLISQILAVSGNDGLGYEIGQSLPLTTHGNLGHAVLCSASLREACMLLERFLHLREPVTEVQVVETAHWLAIELSTRLLLPAELRALLFESLLAVLHRSLRLLIGDDCQQSEAWLDFAMPEYFARYREQLPFIKFDMPVVQYRIPQSLVDRLLPMSNPDAFAQALAQCERESAMLEDVGGDWLMRVRQHLVVSDNGYPTQEQLANQLHMSLRTLRRKLQLHGTSFKAMLETARRRDALRLLDDTAFSIQSIAEQLGYINPSNFTRAFRQWTGRTPRDYRALRTSKS